MAETYEVVSVKDGKFHRPVNTSFERNKSAFQPREMRCGRTLEPHNVFLTVADADSYTGGRIAKYGCKQCHLSE